MRIFKETPKIPFVKWQRFFVVSSLLLVTFSLYLLATRGLNYGTDFLGGVKLQYQFPKEVSEGEIRDRLNQMNLGSVSVIRYGDPGEHRMIIKVSKSEKELESLATLITPELTKTYGTEGLLLESEETVGANVGAELRHKGILAVLFSLLCMLIYIGFRFDFYFAPGALIALFHDVIVVLGVFSLLRLEFNLTILAACLTIVGYSINDTIIIFDRVREHARLITPATLEEVVNTSINETLSRTIITSLTTFLSVVVLYFFGGGTIENFAFALIIGIIAGTYSTFGIACSCYIAIYRWAPKFKFLAGKN